MDFLFKLMEAAGIVLLILLSLGGFLASAGWALALLVGKRS
jgi:hypothetical protein